MSAQPNLNRREFLKVSATAGAGLVICVALQGCGGQPTAIPAPTATQVPTVTPSPEPTTTPLPSPTATPTPKPGTHLEPNLFVRIGEDGAVTITVPRVELGQGVRTALAMIVAEELEADWAAVHVETADADRAFGRQQTTGSHSVEQTFGPLRWAGAIARQMLVAAAASTWGVEAAECRAEAGSVVHTASSQRLSYGDLVETATTLAVPKRSEVSLKDPADFRIIGTARGQIDEPQMVTGHAVYGLDVRLPGMLYATIARCPVFGGDVESLDPAPALAVGGVRDVVQIGQDVAVIAESTWAAIQGREALQVVWNEGRNADLSSDGIRQGLLERLKEQANASPGKDEGTLEAIYEVPFLAHVPMEPISCTADVQPDRCTVWAPTQDPREAKQQARGITNLPDEAVTVHVPLVGGAFGRRSYEDFVVMAVKVSQAAGAPVQVVWTREDDVRHDLYHPFHLIYATAPLDNPRRRTITPYPAPGRVPTGIWRSVDNVHRAFAEQCFLDEFAAATGQDPVALRLSLVPERMRAVLELAAEKAGWGTPLPEGYGRGAACHSTWGVTDVAQVVEVSVAQGGAVRVHRVVCAVDCGLVVNPDAVAAQMEGGIVMGLTAALKGVVTVEKGRVQQSNFHDYPLLRLDEMPAVEVYLVSSNRAPQGVGEMGVPPAAPALANAIFAATGKRVRRLPIRAEDLRGA
jgi:isoquinoline 1-oxidoreductase beta subunit